ncbi:MAG TPA: DNA polymerase III subunit delta [Gemmatimonadales bacterium]|jgi:DNA polymerase-3 subunit delta
MADAFQAARRDIGRGSLSQVYHLIGTEELLKDELITEIIACAADPSTRDFNVDVRQAADVDGESFHALVETPPMLAERRVVVLKHIEQWRKNAKVWQVLERYLEHPSPTTTLVLTEAPKERGVNPVAALLRRRTRQVRCDPLGRGDLREWIQGRTEPLGFSLDADAIDHLIAVTQGDLGTVVSELHKLSAATEGVVGVDEVSVFVGVRRGETPDDWHRSVLMRDVARAIEMLETVLGLSGTTGVSLIGTLGTHLLGLRATLTMERRRNPAAQLVGQFKSAKLEWRLGRPEQVVDLWMQAAPQWSLSELDAAVRAAYEADRKLKSTRTSSDAGILRDCLLACARRREAA